MAALTTEVLDFSITAMLCDSATSSEGKLYLQGAGWDAVSPPNGVYPMRIPRVGIGALISVPFLQTNKNHTMTIALKGEDGQDIPIGRQPADPTDPASSGVKPIHHLEATFNVGRPPFLQNGQRQSIPFAINIDGLDIEKPGSYDFIFEIDEHEVQRLTFRAMPVMNQVSLGSR